MKQLKEGTLAPDFALKNTKDEIVHLLDFRGKKRVVLVLMRGFV